MIRRTIFLALLTLSSLMYSLPGVASDIIGGQAKILTASQLDEASKTIFANRCNETNLMTSPNRGQCDALRTAHLSQGVFNYCHERYKADKVYQFLGCISRGVGRDYPTSYMDACNGTSSTTSREPTVCAEYLANTSSSFDGEAFHFCLEIASKKFDAAISCLNAIRDRQVDVQKLKRECGGGYFAESPLSCVTRLTNSAPAISNCGRPTSSSVAPAKTIPAAGVH